MFFHISVFAICKLINYFAFFSNINIHTFLAKYNINKNTKNTSILLDPTDLLSFVFFPLLQNLLFMLFTFFSYIIIKDKK